MHSKALHVLQCATTVGIDRGYLACLKKRVATVFFRLQRRCMKERRFIIQQSKFACSLNVTGSHIYQPKVVIRTAGSHTTPCWRMRPMQHRRAAASARLLVAPRIKHTSSSAPGAISIWTWYAAQASVTSQKCPPKSQCSRPCDCFTSRKGPKNSLRSPDTLCGGEVAETNAIHSENSVFHALLANIV